MNEHMTIFDVNAYRQLTYGKDIDESISIMEKIKSLEDKKKLQAYCSPFVPVELAYHLCDSNDPAFANCKSALVANYIHTSPSSNSFRLLAEKESLVMAFLFNVRQHPHKNLIESIFKMATDLIDDHSNDPSNSSYCSLIESSVKMAEQDFIDNVLLALKEIDPNFDGIETFKNNKEGRKVALSSLENSGHALKIAFGLVLSAHRELEIDPNHEDIDRMTIDILRIFKAPIKFYHKLLYKLVMASKINMHSKGGKWGNWFWDIEHTFSVTNSLIDSRIPIMVSNDKQLYDNLLEVYDSDRVYKLDEYLEYIGFPA